MGLDYTVTITSIDEIDVYEYDQTSNDIGSMTIRNTKTESYQTAEMTLLNPPQGLLIGMLVEITVNSIDVFKGYISEIGISSLGKKEVSLKLTGLTSLLWRDIIEP